MLYAQRTMVKQEASWVKQAMTENINMGAENWYTRYLLQWKTRVGCFDGGLRQITQATKRAAIKDVLKQQRRTATSTFAMNTPTSSYINRWFKPKPWVSDSGMSKIYAEFRSANMGLGNRGPAKNGERYKLCPLCAKNGEKALNNEVRRG